MGIQIHLNVAYGDHPRQRLDLYQPEGDDRAPLFVWLHGGGFSGGDKSHLPSLLRDYLLGQGVAVASANYRFVDDAELLAPLRDAARAIFFLISESKWGYLDSARVAFGGLSAGGVSACWLVWGEGSRVVPKPRCLALVDTQTTADPRAIRALLPGPAWRIESFQRLFRLTPEQYDEPEWAAWLETFHFPARVTPASPPVFQLYKTPRLPLTAELSVSTAIHHPRFGQLLKERLDAEGVPNDLQVRSLSSNSEIWYSSALEKMAVFIVQSLTEPARV